MSRPDLLALTPEAIASLANLGLVKRAQREIAEGAGPVLEELPDGTVVGQFGDGAVARLPRDTPLQKAECSCGSAKICRHRVAVALAYRSYRANEAPSATAEAPENDRPEQSDPTPRASGTVPWSPAEFDDAALERVLRVKLLDRARAVLRRGLVATVEQFDVPTVKLPSCTVRFLVPHEIAYARCDCAEGAGGCEHVALAVWAFRQAAPDATSTVVALGRREAAVAHVEALDETAALVCDLLCRGIAAAPPAPGRFAELRTRLERGGMVWLYALTVDLEIALEGYQARSARFGTREIANLLLEMAARTRAGKGLGSLLPPRFVLGEDEAPETLLDHVRLVSLGARITADEHTRFADVYLADPDTTLVLVLRKRWDFDTKSQPEEGPALGRRQVAPGVRLDSLAKGQLVSKVVKRRANRSIELGGTRTAQTSVTPQKGDFGNLPAPLLIRDLGEHAARLSGRPPRLLRPRVLAEDVHVIEVAEVKDVRFSAAEQELTGWLTDAGGNPFVVITRHRRAAPYAIENTAAALAAKVRFVAGELSRQGSTWQLEPLCVATDSLVVPDIGSAAPAPIGSGGTNGSRRSTDPWETALANARGSLEELCRTGTAAPSKPALGRARAAAERLDDLGLSGLALRMRALESHARAGGAREAALAWLDAAIRLALTEEARAE